MYSILLIPYVQRLHPHVPLLFRGQATTTAAARQVSITAGGTAGLDRARNR